MTPLLAAYIARKRKHIPLRERVQHGGSMRTSREASFRQRQKSN